VSKVVSMRLKDEQLKRLNRIAHRFNKTLTEAAAQLLEEAIRHEENPYIEFKTTMAGREAFIIGSRLKVWHIVMHSEGAKDDPEKIAAALEIPEHHVRAALLYAKEYPDEIEAALEDNDWCGDHLVPITPGFRPSKPVDPSPS
jgi:uncharacterized protein (DUF433 family)